MKAFSLRDSLLRNFSESKAKSFASLKSTDGPSEMIRSTR